MTFTPREQEIVKNSIEQRKNDDNLAKEENESKYNLTEEQEQEHRANDMLHYVDAPIDRNNMDQSEYKNKLKEHYTRSNNYWDRFKTPLWKPQFSKEEENQLKVAEGNYEKLVNDNTTDFSQQAFEVQEAKEISKISYKENFLDIMNQPDSLRMNRINKMVKERSKLKMPSSFPNDARE